ncbi:MAG: antibiotic biosynthesis monooxygenase [Bacteroidota bacterium]
MTYTTNNQTLTKPVTVLVTARTYQGKADAFLPILMDMIEKCVQKAPGNLSSVAMKDVDDPDRIRLLETWDSQAEHALFFSDLMAHAGEALKEFLEIPFTVEYLDAY